MTSEYEYPEEERFLRETLTMLREGYAKAAMPYIERLVELHRLRPQSILVTVEQAREMGIIPVNTGIKELQELDNHGGV